MNKRNSTNQISDLITEMQKGTEDFKFFFNGDNRYAIGRIPAESIIDLFETEY